MLDDYYARRLQYLWHRLEMENVLVQRNLRLLC
jgi:hypothetical protein